MGTPGFEPGTFAMSRRCPNHSRSSITLARRRAPDMMKGESYLIVLVL